jgi:hypothetical protein
VSRPQPCPPPTSYAGLHRFQTVDFHDFHTAPLGSPVPPFLLFPDLPTGRGIPSRPPPLFSLTRPPDRRRHPVASGSSSPAGCCSKKNHLLFNSNLRLNQAALPRLVKPISAGIPLPSPPQVGKSTPITFYRHSGGHSSLR